MRSRTFIPSDNVGKPCNCLVCLAAGVSHLNTVRVPPDETHAEARWLHGQELKAWHAARDQARDAFKKMAASRSFGGSKS